MQITLPSLSIKSEKGKQTDYWQLSILHLWDSVLVKDYEPHFWQKHHEPQYLAKRRHHQICIYFKLERAFQNSESTASQRNSTDDDK